MKSLPAIGLFDSTERLGSARVRSVVTPSARLFCRRPGLRLRRGLPWRLTLLHLGLLGGMFLLDLLRLLSVVLLHLRFLRVVVVFLGGLLVFFFLLLLELLVILRLLGS